MLDTDRPPGDNTLLGVTVLTLRFLSELALLAAAAVTGAHLAEGVAAVGLAVLLPVLCAGAWGMWAAPRASRRLRDPARLALELVLFLGTACGLAAAGHPALAVVYAAIGVGSALLTRVVAPGR